MSKRHNDYTVAVIGSGLSGTLVATHLLANPSTNPLRVVLTERHASQFGRGVAYATNCFKHLLNVPAGRMSAFIEDQEHFLNWANRKALRIHSDTFAPRWVYGAYLNDVLNEAEASAPKGRQLERVTDEVTAIEVLPRSRGALIKLRDRKSLYADRVVFALGSHAPADPPVDSNTFYTHKRYIRDPWADGALDHIEPADQVLLVGTGLTMIDIALGLRHRGHLAPIHAISRHGLLPHTHRHTKLKASFKFLLQTPITLRGVLHVVRKAGAAAGDQWHTVLDALRPITQDLWRRLTDDERRRFLRHVRHYWDIHRHRMAPEIGRQIAELIAVDQLQVHAGRIRDYRPYRKSVEVVFRERSAAVDRALQVAYVINCTGPDSDILHSIDPLIKHLRRRGYVRPDSLALGLDAAEDGALIDASGRRSKIFYTIGPLLKGKLWETTAVPEIRAQAAALARSLTVLPKQRRAKAFP